MKGVIDRFEGEYAVIELDNKEMIDIERERLPEKAAEGDVLDIGKEIKIDVEETKKRKKEIEEMLEGMWEE